MTGDDFPSDPSALAAEVYACLEYIRDLGFEDLIPPETPKTPAPRPTPSRASFVLGTEGATPSRGAGPTPGFRGLPAPRPSYSPGGPSPYEPPSPRPEAGQGEFGAPPWYRQAGDLEELYHGLSECRLCPLCVGRRKPFPGRGPKRAKAMFVVEPPDRQNAEAPELPSGAMGDLLNDIISKGLKLDPAECLVTPLVKCPVDDPEDSSVLNLKPCAGLCRREIELASPALVLALGLLPGQALAGLDMVMARLRLRKATIGPERIPLRITYGLTAMLAEPVLKKEVWRDLKVIFGLK